MLKKSLKPSKVEDEFPQIIKSGSTSVKLYRTVNRSRTQYTIAFHEGGGRKLRQFSDLTEAKREGKLIADRLNAGQGGALELTGTDRDSYLFATSKLKPFGVPLAVVVEEWIRAKSFNVPLVEAAKHYAETHNAKLPERTVKAVFEEMMAAKQHDGGSEVYLHDLKTRLRHFVSDIRENISNVTTATIDAWLRALKSSPRSRNNTRNAIVTLFNFAKSAGYLDRDRTTVAEHASLAKAKRKAISFFSSEEFAKLLETTDSVIRPMFVLGGFCGLRTIEIQRLRWEDIRWEESVIVISEDTAKGGEARRRRIAPLTPAAAAWLQPWKGKTGRVLPIKQPEHRVKAVSKALGVGWKSNGLRHSFITYRVAQTKDFIKTAFECGNSPTVIRSSYDAVTTEGEAVRWFNILPKAPENVLQLKLSKEVTS